MSTTQVKAISGQELLERLAQLADIGLTTDHGWMINEARTERPIAEAQRVLERHGYYLSDWKMVEGAFYQLTYLPSMRVYRSMEHWPYWVELRYITSSIIGPPLALSYYDEGSVLRAYAGSYPRTYGTNTSDAEKMKFHFAADHPGVEPKWLPVFDHHWPVTRLH